MSRRRRKERLDKLDAALDGRLVEVDEDLAPLVETAAEVRAALADVQLDPEAAERLHWTTEAGQALDRAFEDVAGEVLGGRAVADRGQEEAEQSRGVGGVDAGDGGRLAASRASQIGRCQVDSAEPLLLPPDLGHLPPASGQRWR